MFSKLLFVIFAAALAAEAAPVTNPADPPVFTATRVYQTITDVPPYIVDATTVITWTQSPTTSIVDPDGPGI
ncbi:hypothetical protein R3P38DRAFT_3176617 [Favolaschia claudopus]|uniref:Uncharacterized protein n=1 Tax=Favolaschia claudopus TaxID=2862362 RepID=A0AAW0CY87_9AGAR